MIPVQNCTTEIMTKQGVSEFVDARRTVTWTRTSRDTEDTLTSDLSSSLRSISKATTSTEYGDALEETQKKQPDNRKPANTFLHADEGRVKINRK